MDKHLTSNSIPLDEGATEKFPAPVYCEAVLAANFADAKRYFLTALLQIECAHTIMLERQRIISRDDARACLAALNRIDIERIRSTTYDGTHEDLFFYVENLLASDIGIDIAGRMHTARSRNDIDLTLYRMCVRAEILKCATDVADAHQALLDLAAVNVDTVMPAYTHTQPAQPTTFAHYLIAAIEFLERDFDRLSSAWTTVNCNPLGACAITTTAFPIDRNLTADLLGFEGLQTNSYGAIAAVDYITEAVSAIAVCMINLGKLVQDLLQWCAAEFNFLRLTDSFVQTSSIMPQKRNPVSLEHTRILASKAFAQAQAVMTCTHNTPFGDIVDSEDDLQPLVFATFEDAGRALRLFTGIMRHCEVNREQMATRARTGFLTVTELADTLVRSDGLSFRLAHRLVRTAVESVGEYDEQKMVVAVQNLATEIIGRPLRTPVEVLREALDPEHFVAIRKIPGGPAPEVVRTQLQTMRTCQEKMNSWISLKTESEAQFPKRIAVATAAILGK
ncbi:MAG TPA: argininosuccinate lyase [Terriglobales bacterium]|nr:argininosuccinate lyase [Terriglobales bacterium]